MFQTEVSGKINTPQSCFSENILVYEKMWYRQTGHSWQ